MKSMASVLAEAERWIVLDKPSGWLTIPGRGQERPVLLAWAQERFGQLWTVHRIDVETSGVVLFARSAEAHREANTWFEKHQVRKAYDFLAAGNPARPVFGIRKPIHGAASVTQVEVRERFTGAFLGRAVPLSGRRHQIRIHLAGEGHPLLGDVEYGGTRQVERVALHAARLELPTGESFEAPWPEDFKEWVRALREGELHVGS